MVALGNVIGYSSILLPQLKYEDSPIKLNSSDESWIGETCCDGHSLRIKINFSISFPAAIATVSMAIACMLAGVVIEKYGRKSIFQIMNIPLVVGWSIFYFSINVNGLLLGRFLTGFCVGLLSTPVPVYISEITQPTYRGLFLSAQCVAVAFGILMPHALGMYVKWEFVALICAAVPLLCYILIEMVPESPSWLLDDGQMDKASKSFTWFRGHYLDSKYEFEKLVEGQKLSKLQNEPMAFHNILTMASTKSFYKPLLILLVFSVTLQASGPYVIAFYTVDILKNSIGGNMNEYVATIILDVTRLAASFVSCIVIKNVGRRPLAAFSGITTAASLFSLSAYLFCASMNESLKQLYGIPLTLYTLYMISITLGLNPLTWTLTGELFPLRYRGVGSALVTFFNFVCFFVSVKVTPALFVALGEQGVLLLFGICCFTGTIIIITFLPETHNKTLQQIEDSYDNRRTIANQRTKSTKIQDEQHP